jgi:hypothetical protein
LPITMFFKKARAAEEPTQSTSWAEPGPITSSTTCTLSPKPFLHLLDWHQAPTTPR